MIVCLHLSDNIQIIAKCLHEYLSCLLHSAPLVLIIIIVASIVGGCLLVICFYCIFIRLSPNKNEYEETAATVELTTGQNFDRRGRASTDSSLVDPGYEAHPTSPGRKPPTY